MTNTAFLRRRWVTSLINCINVCLVDSEKREEPFARIDCLAILSESIAAPVAMSGQYTNISSAGQSASGNDGTWLALRFR